MSTESIIQRYVDLLLGPAGLDELPIPGATLVIASDPDGPLPAAIVKRIRDAGGLAQAFSPDGPPPVGRPMPPPAQLILKDPTLVGGDVPAPDLGIEGLWPHKVFVAPCPTENWARSLWPDDPGALDRLWSAIADACRLDPSDGDVDGGWHRRHLDLERRASLLGGLDLDRLRFVDAGSGTDLTVGLLPGSRWQNGRAATARGVPFVANIPCEEIHTAPDPGRVEGVVVATQPVAVGGVLVEGLRAEFVAGDARLTATAGEDELHALLAGANERRLGEVALVDGESRVGRSGITFGDPLLDENAACHIAFGQAVPGSFVPDERERVNRAGHHLDVVIGTGDTEVWGISRAGEEIPLLCAGRWQDSLASAEEPADPERIGPILDALAAVWQRSTDLRLGQVLRNAVPGLGSDMGLETLGDAEVRLGLERAARQIPHDPYVGRDPARIPVLVEALRVRWQAEPDRRLCQLLRSIARRRGFMSDSGFARMEDNLWLGGLEHTAVEESGGIG